MIPILVALAALTTFFVIAMVAARNRASFEERFPPISDAEFLARCSPGVDPKVALKIRRIVAGYFDIPYERVHPSMRIIDDLAT